VARLVQRLQNRVRSALRRLFGGGFERCPGPDEIGGLSATCQEGHDFSAIVGAWNRLHAAVPTAIAIVRLLATVKIMVMKNNARSAARSLKRSDHRLGSLMSHAVTRRSPAKAGIAR